MKPNILLIMTDQHNPHVAGFAGNEWCGRVTLMSWRLDPLGRLWSFWTQSCPMLGEAWDGRGGVWTMVTENPEDAKPQWSEPRRIAHGIALNRPLVVSSGEWILPTALWKFFEQLKELDPIRKPGVVASTDQGETWHWRGGAVVDERVFDEPMVVEKQDGTLWMLVRTRFGIAESFSMDGGISWSRGRPSMFASPSTRFHFRRLASGRLLFIHHFGNRNRKRSHLTALLSEDDGQTWPHRLLLDDRMPVSYPDAIEGPDGVLRIVYDSDRYGQREILMARLLEEDIVNGKCSDGSALRLLVNKAGV
ncbi:MAG: exo-alpha-sialidase [Planctomycetota bacterium]|jgi:hypothetical protein|nr:exo-alpha-sialidase [Planctomycetota bacterium]MDP7249667.1 exo-alpha-sialidase [Planctomycetota bacterium]